MNPSFRIRPAASARSRPRAPGAFPSHSDANLLFSAGMKPILMGPGRLEMAHAPEESVAISQIEEAVRLYLAVMTRMEGHFA